MEASWGKQDEMRRAGEGWQSLVAAKCDRRLCGGSERRKSKWASGYKWHLPKSDRA